MIIAKTCFKMCIYNAYKYLQTMEYADFNL